MCDLSSGGSVNSVKLCRIDRHPWGVVRTDSNWPARFQQSDPAQLRRVFPVRRPHRPAHVGGYQRHVLRGSADPLTWARARSAMQTFNTCGVQIKETGECLTRFRWFVCTYVRRTRIGRTWVRCNHMGGHDSASRDASSVQRSGRDRLDRHSRRVGRLCSGKTKTVFFRGKRIMDAIIVCYPSGAVQ